MFRYENLTFEISEAKNYRPSEKISESGSADLEAGVIAYGTAFLESMDKNGARRIIDIYRAGDVFFSAAFPSSNTEGTSLVAKTRCTVFSMEKPGALEKKMPAEMYNRLLSHIYILGRRTLREKITAFFELERKRQGSDTFKMEISLSDMADYIGADRSAMMRDLRKMQDEGIIARNRKLVKLN